MDVSTETPVQTKQGTNKPGSKQELGDEGLKVQEPVRASSKEASRPSGEADVEPPLSELTKPKSSDDVAKVVEGVAGLRGTEPMDPTGQQAEEMASHTESVSKPEEAKAEDPASGKLQTGDAQTTTFAWKIGSLSA
ncbi:uncharacterized protein LOC115313098 [Ixodes scapularis]|uniref:uncharacterized protein LOC115313098 n=1 Tax=Ixodes scapularis TaxID=6945 RepID=UPI001A9F8D6B|nr:uncharacterized protein LOC115313098 [Ixodes scapularis]